MEAEISRDRASTVAAGVTYFGILSIFPFLIFVIALSAYVVPLEAVHELIIQLELLLPEQAAQVVIGEIIRILTVERPNVLAFSIVFTIWTASRGVGAVGEAMNEAYNVKETRSYVHRKLLSIAGAIFAALVILLAGGAIVAGDAIFKSLVPSELAIQPLTNFLFQFIRFGLSMGMIMILWSFIYWALPDRKASFKLFTWGSVAGVLIWVAASAGFSIYVSRFGEFQATYGSLGSIIIFLLWLYVSSFSLIVGAEINVVLEARARKKQERTQQQQAVHGETERPYTSEGRKQMEPIKDRSKPWSRDEGDARGLVRDMDGESMQQLVREILDNTKVLAQDSLRLARLEIKEEARSYMSIMGLVTAGAIWGVVGFLLVSFAICLALLPVMGPWAFVLVGAVYMAACAGFMYEVKKRTKANKLLPQTRQEVAKSRKILRNLATDPQ